MRLSASEGVFVFYSCHKQWEKRGRQHSQGSAIESKQDSIVSHTLCFGAEEGARASQRNSDKQNKEERMGADRAKRGEFFIIISLLQRSGRWAQRGKAIHRAKREERKYKFQFAAGKRRPEKTKKQHTARSAYILFITFSLLQGSGSLGKGKRPYLLRSWIIIVIRAIIIDIWGYYKKNPLGRL